MRDSNHCPRKFTEFSLECSATDPALACRMGGEISERGREGIEKEIENSAIRIRTSK